MNLKMVLIGLFGLIGAFFAFLSQYKMLFFYVFCFMAFLGVFFKIVKTYASRRISQIT